MDGEVQEAEEGFQILVLTESKIDTIIEALDMGAAVLDEGEDQEGAEEYATLATDIENLIGR